MRLRRAFGSPGDSRESWRRFRVESYSENGGQSLLPLRDPGGVVAAYHRFRVAEQLGDVSDRHAGSFEQDPGEGVSKPVRRWLLLPGATQRPEPLQLSSPKVGDDIDVVRRVLAEDERPVAQCARP